MSTKKIIQFSALGFILSNIGAAVGIGNIWRFPSVMIKNGGSAFIFVYFIVLLAIVLPIIFMEMNYGLFFKKNLVSTFYKTSKAPGIFLGWKQTLLNGFLCFYYLVIMAWIGIGLVLSVVPSLFKSLALDSNWFNENILSYNKDTLFNQSNDQLIFKNVSFTPWILISAVVLMLIIFIIVKSGIKSGLEKANYIFVPGLFIMLFGLTIYAVFFLKNGIYGASALFKFDSKQIGNPLVWYEASKQAIFSTSVMFGVILVFSKSADIRMDKGNEAIIIVLTDTFIGLISGLLISSFVSHDVGNTLQASKTFSEENLILGIQNKFNAKNSILDGSGLLFSYLPQFFWTFNNGANFGFGNFLMIIFCINLLFASISSIIALLEVWTDTFVENLKISRTKSITFWFSLALIFLFLYSTSFGSKLINAQDNMILFFILFVGFFEVLIFAYSKYYKEVAAEHDKYSFIKLKPFKWHALVLKFITIPIIFILLVIGFFETFGLSELIVESDWYTNLIGNNEDGFWNNFKEATLADRFTWNAVNYISLAMMGVLGTLVGSFSYITYKKKLNKVNS